MLWFSNFIYKSMRKNVKRRQFNKDLLQSNWRPPSLSELTAMIFNTGLTHLGSEASNCKKKHDMVPSAILCKKIKYQHLFTL